MKSEIPVFVFGLENEKEHMKYIEIHHIPFI